MIHRTRGFIFIIFMISFVVFLLFSFGFKMLEALGFIYGI